MAKIVSPLVRNSGQKGELNENANFETFLRSFEKSKQKLFESCKHVPDFNRSTERMHIHALIPLD